MKKLISKMFLKYIIIENNFFIIKGGVIILKKYKMYCLIILFSLVGLAALLNSGEIIRAKDEFIETNKLYFSIDDASTNLKSVEIREKEKIVVNLNSEDETIETAKIKLPEDVMVDLDATKERLLEQYPEIKDSDEIVTEEQGELQIALKTQTIYISKVPLVLGFKEGEKQIDSQKLDAQTIIGGQTYHSPELLLIPINENSRLEKSWNETKSEETKIQPRAGNLNVDIHIGAVFDKIESGADGVFEFNFKTTGSQTLYKNGQIEIQLPDNAVFDQELNQLMIAGVTPTYEPTTHQLHYFFEEIEGGISCTQIIKVKTENGLTENGTKLKASAVFTADDFEDNTYTEATITVGSSLGMSSSKDYTKTLDPKGNEREGLPQPKDTGIWQLKMTIPKKERGQMYLQEGSKIVITDQLPKELKYVENSGNGVHDAKNNTITWIFDAPSIKEQEEAEQTIFSMEDSIKTVFPEGIKSVAKYTNNATFSVIDINGNEIIDKDSAQISVFPNTNEVTPPIQGALLVPSHYGPLNGKGEYSLDSSNMNPTPSVYDSALLGFYFNSTPYKADNPNKPFESYEVTYNIDEHLDLNAFRFSAPEYAPNYGYYSNGTSYYLPDSANKMKIYGTIDGKEQLLLTNPPSMTFFNMKDLGVTGHISKLRIHYNYRSAGTSQAFNMKYDIQKGYTGKVKNSLGINYVGYNNQGNKVSSNQIAGNSSTVISRFSEDRTANVVKVPVGNNEPIVSNTIKFDKEENGLVFEGKNRLKGTFKVDPSSAVDAKGPFETYVLLPEGVHLDKENPDEKITSSNSWISSENIPVDGKITIEDEDFLDQSRQLVLVKKNTNLLSVNQVLNYEFNIIIDDDASPTLQPEAYSFLKDTKFKVPKNSGNSITDSVIEEDSHDLTGNGDKTQKLVKTANQYFLTNSNGIMVKELIKGELDEEFSLFGLTNPGGDIDYKMELTNTGSSKLSTLTLMNVLPSVGDLGITDNDPLNSKFTPILTGPVDLTDIWENKVDIYYSTATNPSRKDLIKDVNYPSSAKPIQDPAGAQDPNWMTENEVKDWSEIHSFMLKLKAGQAWNAAEVLTLDFNMKAPEKLDPELTNSTIPERDRAAWNSFAYTVNHLQPVEPRKVGVAVNNDFNLKVIKESESNSDQKLKDAEFTLYDQQMIQIDQQLTNDNGEINFMNLAPGTYYLQETKAPINHQLNPTLYEIEIKSNGEVSVKNPDELLKNIENADEEAQITLTLANRPVRIINTGSQEILVSFIVGILAVSSGAVYLIKRRRQSK